MKCGIYVRVYNEKNIIEWMDYHYKCGFDFILFYDDYSEPSVKSIIEDYGKFDKSKYLVLERLFEKTNYGISSCLNNGKIFKTYILPHIQKHMDYVLYIDMDEYLYLNKYKNIKELIKDFGNFDSIYINWKIFGKNILKNDSNQLINTFLYSKKDYHNMGKTLSKVSSIKTSVNPHTFSLHKNDNDSITLNVLKEKTKKKQIAADEKINPKLNKYNSNNIIYIAHYMAQDLTTFFYRRFYNMLLVENSNNTELIKKYNDNFSYLVKNYNNIKDKSEFIKNKLSLFYEYENFSGKQWIKNHSSYKRFIQISDNTISNKDIYNFYYDIDTTINNKNKIEN